MHYFYQHEWLGLQKSSLVVTIEQKFLYSLTESLSPWEMFGLTVCRVLPLQYYLKKDKFLSYLALNIFTGSMNCAKLTDNL
jgi:hypothetical protein